MDAKKSIRMGLIPNDIEELAKANGLKPHERKFAEDLVVKLKKGWIDLSTKQANWLSYLWKNYVTKEIKPKPAQVFKDPKDIDETIDFSKKTIPQLKEFCREYGITGYSGLKKEDLVKFITERIPVLKTIEKIPDETDLPDKVILKKDEYEYLKYIGDGRLYTYFPNSPTPFWVELWYQYLRSAENPNDRFLWKRQYLALRREIRRDLIKGKFLFICDKCGRIALSGMHQADGKTFCMDCDFKAKHTNKPINFF